MRYVAMRVTRRKGEERPERELPNRFQLCDYGDVQRNHCVLECVVEMYDEIPRVAKKVDKPMYSPPLSKSRVIIFRLKKFSTSDLK